MDEQNWSSMVVRPDFYVYGGAEDPTRLTVLVGAMIADLPADGICPSTSQPKEQV